nr:hypothetical protein 5 [Gammaproteobacteria bacterium]
MYEAMVFIEKDLDIDIRRYADSVKSFYEESSGHKPKLKVSDPTLKIKFDDIEFKATLICNSDVENIAKNISRMAKPENKPKVAASKCILNIKSSPDYDMVYFNDYLFLIHAAEKIGNVWAYDPNQREFM